jgi:hypothetical protein
MNVIPFAKRAQKNKRVVGNGVERNRHGAE